MECDYQLYKREADRSLRSGNYENAIINYKRAYSVINREEVQNSQAEAYYKWSHKAISKNNFINYEMYISNYLKLRKQSYSARQRAKKDLKFKIDKLKAQKSTYYNSAIESAKRIFPADVPYFIPLPAKAVVKPSKPKTTVKRYPPQDERIRREREKVKEREKRSRPKKKVKKYKPQSYLFITANMTNPPDPIGYYSPGNQYVLSEYANESVTGFGGGLGVNFSQFSMIEFSAHYHIKKYEYTYDYWSPYYGWFSEDREMDNSFINIDVSLYLKFNFFYFGGGGSYAIMSIRETNIDELADAEKMNGFGYHYGGGIMLLKETIWVDIKQYTFSLNLPGGEKENFEFLVFGLRLNARF